MAKKIFDAFKEFFSRSDVQHSSGVMSSESRLFSVGELSQLISEIIGSLVTEDQILWEVKVGSIEVTGMTGYGRNTRSMEVVWFGKDIVGLNTENNFRTALLNYFADSGFETICEFDDTMEHNAKLLTDPQLNTQSLQTGTNKRDMIAVRENGYCREIWLIEVKGHTGVEGWDFFHTLIGQWIKLKTFANRIQYYADKMLGRLDLHCCMGLPGIPIKAHNWGSCYQKEINKLRNFFVNKSLLQACEGRKTYENLLIAMCAGYRIQDEKPLVLSVCGVDKVVDGFTGGRLDLNTFEKHRSGL